MTQIAIDAGDKEWFEAWREDGETHAEAFHSMRRIVEAYEGEPVDVERLADELRVELLGGVELAAYRGSKAAVEDGSG